MEEPQHISIDVVSDAVCPWCYIGRARLQQAMAGLDDIAVDLNWRPFQLDPTIPPGGKPRRQYLMDKFHDEKRIAEVHKKIEETGASDGIDFRFDAIAVSPNTLDAHRVVRWAASAGDGVQDRLVGRLFALYFEEGADIGDHAVLIAAAADSGMDRALVETLLPTEADKAEVQTEIATAQRMGITGVPCFLIEGRYALVGAQPADALADAIRQVAAAKARGELDQAGS
jgi:predicted DsbA family dithiol-disulfide isomerase